MSKIYILLFHLIHMVYSTGEWVTCTSDNLALAKQDVINMDSEIRQLLVNNSVTIADTDIITIESCQSQVVTGTNFRLTINFGIIQYYVGLPTDPNRVNRVPTNFQYLGPNTDTILCMCTMEWNPVCYQGTTYGNECGANCAGATNGTFTMGECATTGTGTITGGYNDYTDLNTIQTQVNQIENDIKTLLKDSGVDISDNALISIISAQTQVVAGVYYRVTIDVASYTNVIIQYFIGLPHDENNQIPQDIQLIDVGENRADTNIVGAYNDVSDLTDVTNTVSNIDSAIRQLLISKGMSITDNDMVFVVSATQQVVTGAGMNYMVTLNIGTYTNVIIKYYIAFDDHERESPQDLEIVDLGVIVGGWSDMNDLEYTKGIVDSIHDEIILLLQNNNLNVNNDAEIVVIGAQSQVVVGMNYRVTINVGLHENIIIQYCIQPGSGIPIDLQVIDLGIDGVDNYGSYKDVDSDLQQVRTDINKIEGDLRTLLVNNNILQPGENAAIVVVSAQRQIVAGTNYKVTLIVGMYNNIIISYFVPLSSDDAQQMPINLKLINSETMMELVRQDIISVKNEIISALNEQSIDVSNDANIKVLSAQSQVVSAAGTNYRATIWIGNRVNVVVQYYVPLPVDGQRQSPQNVQVIDVGFVETLASGCCYPPGEKIKRAWIVAAVVFALVIIGCIVVKMSLWNKKRKLQKMEEKYAHLKEQEMTTTDAIGE